MNNTQTAASGRLPSLDIARGLIMAFMALDHVRIFFSNAQGGAVNPETTNLALFLTRWITHFCAPGFFFVAGVGVSLYLARGATRAAAAGFLLSRGVWLILLELTVIGFAWSFNPGWSWLGVIWSLGASFIIMAGLIYAPRLALAILGVLIVFFHPLLGGDALLSQAGPIHPVAALLYTGGPASLPLLGPKGVLYPVLPWLGMMMLGFAVGPLFSRTPGRRAQDLALLGLSAIGLFIFLRLTNFYGNPETVFGGWSGRFSVGADLASTIINFLNTDKYPASPQFALMTLGPMLLMLALWARLDAERESGPLLRPLEIIGRVPFFFYILHLFLIHGLALLLAILMNQPQDLLFWDGVYPRLRPPPGYGYSLPIVHVVWIAVCAMLYAACAWFEPIKRKYKIWWLRYL